MEPYVPVVLLFAKRGCLNWPLGIGSWRCWVSVREVFSDIRVIGSAGWASYVNYHTRGVGLEILVRLGLILFHFWVGFYSMIGDKLHGV